MLLSSFVIGADGAAVAFDGACRNLRADGGHSFTRTVSLEAILTPTSATKNGD